jgi:aspartyl-tRNA(Asn)/glutamyl-tRNA(Gln) amidotransferase subunit A
MQCLKQAGAVIVGRTNMTEFAFSGVGLNPHFGTPPNRMSAQSVSSQAAHLLALRSA